MFVTKGRFEELQQEVASLKNRLHEQAVTIDKMIEAHQKAATTIEALHATLSSRESAQKELETNILSWHQSRDLVYNEIDAKVRELYDIRERKLSDEPWVEVIGGDVDPERGLQMRLDWNDAFIEQLRAQGYRGTSESTLVGQWLLNVSNTVTDGGDGA